MKAAARDDEIEDAVRGLLSEGVEGIGVNTLWSFANPSTERQVADVVRRIAPGTFLTLSRDRAGRGRVRAASTAALNSRLGPVVKRYLDTLQEKLAAEGFSGQLLVAQAYGGLLPVAEAAARPVGMIESGP